MKDFDKWNKVKKKLFLKNRVKIKSRSIWFCNFGINVGYEINGKDKDFIRPALVLVGFGKSGGIVLPLTTSTKKSKFLIHLKGKSRINITQIRYFDSKRFYRKVGKLSSTNFDKIKKEFIYLLNK